MGNRLILNPVLSAGLGAAVLVTLLAGVQTTAVRLPAVLLFLLIGPGAIIVRAAFGRVAEQWDLPLVATLVFSISITVDTVSAQAMVFVHEWRPITAVALTVSYTHLTLPT